MCGGVLYSYKNHEIKTYFPNPNAMLPIKCKNGDTELMPWGRRQSQAGNLPLGGWARLESIKAGRWNKYFPKAVKLPMQGFMEKDIEGKSHWFQLTDGQYIQGLLARYDHEMRVYVVTVTPEMENAIHERWPRILGYVIS